MVELSPETRRRVELLFRAEHRDEVTRLLREQCGQGLPGLERQDAIGLERQRFAALKLSEGEVAKLRQAIALARIDWRDLLVAAGFADDVHAHARWLPGA